MHQSSHQNNDKNCNMSIISLLLLCSQVQLATSLFFLTTFSQTQKKQSILSLFTIFLFLTRVIIFCMLFFGNCFKLENKSVKRADSCQAQNIQLFHLKQQRPQLQEVLSLFQHTWKSYKDGIHSVIGFYRNTFNNYYASFTTDPNHKIFWFVHGPSFSAFKPRNFTDVSSGSQTQTKSLPSTSFSCFSLIKHSYCFLIK